MESMNCQLTDSVFTTHPRGTARESNGVLFDEKPRDDSKQASVRKRRTPTDWVSDVVAPRETGEITARIPTEVG